MPTAVLKSHLKRTHHTPNAIVFPHVGNLESKYVSSKLNELNGDVKLISPPGCGIVVVCLFFKHSFEHNCVATCSNNASHKVCTV